MILKGVYYNKLTKDEIIYKEKEIYNSQKILIEMKINFNPIHLKLKFKTKYRRNKRFNMYRQVFRVKTYLI